MSNAKFIVVDGTDGVGKSSLIEKLADKINATGKPVAIVTLTDGTELIKLMRHYISNPAVTNPDATTMSLFFSSVLHDAYIRLVKPKLDAGITVICDRGLLSTMVYQHDSLIRDTIFDVMTKLLPVDKTFVLDAPPCVIKSRLTKRLGPKVDYTESWDKAVISERRKRYITLANRSGGSAVIIDASGSLENAVNQCFNKL